MTSTPAQRLAELGEEYFRVKHAYDPFNATLLGLTEFDGQTGSPSVESSAGAESTFADLGRQVGALDEADLTAEEAVDREVLQALLRGAEDDARDSLWAANLSGAGYVSRQGTLLQALAATTVSDDETARRYVERLTALPAYARELGERYRHEIDSGRTPTAIGVRNAIGQLRSEAEGGASSTLLRPVSHDGGAPWREEAGRLAQEAAAAFAQLADVLEQHARPVARDDEHVGVGYLPGGDAAYAAALRQHTTTSRTPEEIHQTGLDFLDELGAAWAEIGQQAFGVSDRREIAERLRSDPALRFETTEQVVDVVAGALHRAEEALPRYFPTDVPVGPCDIVELSAEESANSALAYYRPPAVDGSRNGAQCIATSDPTTRFRYEYEALSFHESVPGHHLQLATTQLLDIPRYRRYLDAEVCGFNEGWGLYTEQLADELGLYSDDYARLGMLSFQALRACRLVVDTGMHAFGWTRRRAVDFMWENTATTRDHIEHEVDRYICWPGQACAYGVGKREIQRMRARAESALGAAFDLPGFHWAVIRNGAIPLSVADAATRAWQDSAASDSERTH
jgi:uncharacterized protein (DUF885 family)